VREQGGEPVNAIEISTPENRQRRRSRLLVGGIVASSILGGVVLVFLLVDLLHPAPIHWIFWPPSPEDVWDAYVHDEETRDFVPEAFICDLFILAGDSVAPLVTDKIQKRDAPKRGYAILFLGDIGYRPALPVLEKIVLDGQEEAADRECALRSITMIDWERGTALSKQMRDQEGVLGYGAKRILQHPSEYRAPRTRVDVILFRG